MLEELVQNILKMHNDARRYAPGVERPPLIWDNELEEAAKSHSKVLAGRKSTSRHSFYDSNNRNQGENIYWEARNVSEAEMYHRAISYWTNENSRYQGQNINLEDLGKWGHYTQIIWPSTTRVGCASAKTKSGATYIVARYSTRGNVIGESAYGMAYDTGTFPAPRNGGVGSEGSGTFTLSPDKPYEKGREEPSLVQLYPSYQPTRRDPGIDRRQGSLGNVSDFRSYQPATGAGDTGAEERTIGLSRVLSYQPVTGNKIQGQSTPTKPRQTVRQDKVSRPAAPSDNTTRSKVRIKNLFREIEEPIRKFSPRRLFGKEQTPE
ncbi:hypothetical protein NHQ30_006079 [Ciborinia camelliae]|nr:hypothetical protein NHQ30_006079 [Ciborinia camelliae]